MVIFFNDQTIGKYLNTLAAGASAGWYFSRPYKNGFLLVLSVEPQSGPDQSPGYWSGGGSEYPTFTNVGMLPGPGQQKLETELSGEPDKKALLELHLGLSSGAASRYDR